MRITVRCTPGSFENEASPSGPWTSRLFRHLAALLAWAMGLGLLSGCQPQHYRQQADRVAYESVQRAQKQSLGRTEPFSIETPADTLRRRLLLDQDLPVAGAASLGTDQLKPVPHWPEKNFPRRQAGQGGSEPAASQPGGPVTLSLVQALQVAARNNRDYQTSKEDLFRSALTLDLEANAFRNIFAASGQSDISTDLGGAQTVSGLVSSGTASWQRRLANGTLLTAQFAIDLARLLTADRSSSLGLVGDATISVPLLRGSGSWIVQESLTQAERSLVYSLFSFERLKQTLAVRVASGYLGVLQQLDQVRNAQENYKSLIASSRRARRLADAGRLPQIQVDQGLQDELRARDRWITAQESYARSLDNLKITLGLPTDSLIELDRQELSRLAAAGANVADSATAPAASGPATATQPATAPATTSAPTSAPASDAPIVLVGPRSGQTPLEMPPPRAIRIALSHRLDLRTALGRVYDAQRKVVVAADGLQAELTLTGSANAGSGRGSVGSAALPDAQLRPEKGSYSAGLAIDLPLERTAERNAYRNSLIALEQSARGAQDLEDQVKLEVRDALRGLLQAREGFTIQAQAVTLAKRRVDSTQLFLEAGRAEIRDLLDAQESLLSAQNALTAALVNYRVAELGLQRDMGVLAVDEKGNWHEYVPKDPE